MAENLTQILDRVDRTIKRLLSQFRGQPNMEAIAASYGAQFQEIEDVLWQLYTERWLSTATGAQLDELGRMLGEPRGDKNDDDYRAALYARIALNRSNGRIEDILFAMTNIKDDRYQLRELGDATLVVRLLDAISTVSAAIYDDALQQTKAAGVEAVFQYSSDDDENTFRWAVGDTVESTTTEGWSNDAGTDGGSWSDAL
jgi:hypothetical protein